MKSYLPLVYVALLTTAVLAPGCSSQQITEQAFIIAGYTGSVQVAQSNSRELSPITQSAVQSLVRSATSLSETNEDTGINKLNGIGGSVRIPLSQFTFRALDLCRHYHKLTGGAYDFTTGALAELWRKGEPDETALIEARARSGMKFLETADNGTAALTIPGVNIYPGLMIPAYSLDVCLVDIRRKFNGPMLIRYGPFARREGKFPPEQPPLIPVTAPEELSRVLIGDLDLSETIAVAQLTLPHREIRPGQRPSRVLVDPRTGRPASGAKLAVVTGPLVIKSYVLAEALLILGLEEGTGIMTNFPGYEAMIIPDREPAECWMTPGFHYLFRQNQAFPFAMREWLIEE